LQVGRPGCSHALHSRPINAHTGNTTHPNQFTANILRTLGELQGSLPILRIGGNTQDRTMFHPSQAQGIISGFEADVSADYPSSIEIGPAYFESHAVLPDFNFVHGLNGAMGGSGGAGLHNVLQHAAAACKAIGDRLLAWEWGNEPDMWALAHDYRLSNYDEAGVFTEWNRSTAALLDMLQEECPESTKDFFAPSFARPEQFMNVTKAWGLGLDARDDIPAFVQHK
jgi:hypothetical protein